MTRILGIDPGSRITGFGVIEIGAQGMSYVASGCVRLGDGEMGGRLRELFTGMGELLVQYGPDEVAIERIFMRTNVATAIKLGQARGVALCAIALHDRPVYEYSAAEVKKAVAGSGRAAKEHIQMMTQQRLKLAGWPQVDAADALAVAMCHAQTRAWRIKTGAA
ncbi:MAG: crossover junction endodeoxyribonuclease RuvC [Pseudomonadota bacterium]